QKGRIPLDCFARKDELKLRRLLYVEPEFGDHAFAHDEFLDLSGHRHREFVDEFDVARHLIVRDLIAAEGANFLFARAHAGAQLDPGANLLAIAIVGDADHLHVLDLRMAIEEFLNLARIDVFATADDHVLDAADDVAIALRIDGSEVAGVHPARRIDRLARARFVIPIAEHHAIAARQQLARRAGRHDAPLAIDDFHLDMRLNAPDRGDAPLQWIGRRALETDRARFRHAVSDGDFPQVHFGDGALHHLDRTWRTGHDPGAQRGKIKLFEFRMIELGDEHGRHSMERGAALLGHRLQRGERIETFAGKYHAGAVGDRREIAEHHAEAMVERHRNAQFVLRRKPHRFADEKP